ncbi:HNH endonuclease [Nocardioides sp. Arc9.136]|uniref:HNH endonuclease n=1 Tax=Nocardioides sp. Arc9.136 TaxID=2996826 RepID=UPI002666F7BD|nr:HNH endonuclease signature motif containing protein [Nocardioides sp. Arc9.136]WKN48919.1 HNH endonuclease signature motif containing protein [Nocardioides sp. Arc9.136]
MAEVVYVPDGNNEVLKSAIWDAWGSQCWWCGEPIKFRHTQIDHLLPKAPKHSARAAELVAELGLDEDFNVHDPRNLGPICGACNQEKSTTDYTRTDRILSKLRKAGRFRSKVIRHVERFHSDNDLAAAMLRAKLADVDSEEDREVLREHGPGLLRALAYVTDGQLDYVSFRHVEVGQWEPRTVVVALAPPAQRVLTVLEEVCAVEIEAALAEPLRAVEAKLVADAKGGFEGWRGSVGQIYPGDTEFDRLDLQVGTIRMARSGSLFEFEFLGEFEGDLTADLQRDDVNGELQGTTGGAFLTGTFRLDFDWDSADDTDLRLVDVDVYLGTNHFWID